MEDDLFERLAVAQARKRGEDAEPRGFSETEVREEDPDG